MLAHVYQDRFETIRQLGEGGMGKVFLARDRHLARDVVIKVMHDRIVADANFRERFQRETLLTAQFTHPYAVTVYDAYPNDPQGPFILMEYIKGDPLDVVLARCKRMEPRRVARLLRMLCDVLQAAHSKNLIHRDLKPSNLMIVDPDTPYEILKVMDFGLAKLLQSTDGSRMTQHDFAVGTPGYMCPEQARGEEMDNRGDIYSVGVILYELLTGNVPFKGQNTMEVLVAHAIEEPPSFSEQGVVGVVPRAIEDVVKSCLAKNPDDRPQSARVLFERFEAALNQTESSPSAPAVPGKVTKTTSTLPPVKPVAPVKPGAATQVKPGVVPLPSPPKQEPEPPPRTITVSGPSSQGLNRRPTGSSVHVTDPTAVVHFLEAWMPERIAAFKLKGFIQDVGGQLMDSVPGRILVKLGGPGCRYSLPTRGLSWLGLARRPYLEMRMHLERTDIHRESQLKITVVFSSPSVDLNISPTHRELCTKIFLDLRGYLMGDSQRFPDAPR